MFLRLLPSGHPWWRCPHRSRITSDTRVPLGSGLASNDAWYPSQGHQSFLSPLGHGPLDLHVTSSSPIFSLQTRCPCHAGPHRSLAETLATPSSTGRWAHHGLQCSLSLCSYVPMHLLNQRTGLFHTSSRRSISQASLARLICVLIPVFATLSVLLTL